jgi:hypothetical protein
MKCSYCGNDRDGVEGWHGCPQSMDTKARIEERIESMTRIANNQERRKAPETSEQMRSRADQLREMANGVRLTGGITKPEYEEPYDGR